VQGWNQAAGFGRTKAVWSETCTKQRLTTQPAWLSLGVSSILYGIALMQRIT